MTGRVAPALLTVLLAGSAPLRAQVPAPSPCARTVEGVAIDGRSALPLGFAAVRGPCGATVADAEGRFRIAAAPGDTLRVGRVGYRPARVAVTGITLRVALAPAAVRLAPVAVTARSDPPHAPGRLAATRDADALRVAGATTVADGLAQLPFLTARAARGEVSLSMRGARAEQVGVTLDGLSLADAATGRANVDDLPLAAIGSASVSPGADPVANGSGATGGTLALTSATRPVLAVGVGSYGQRRLEGAGVLALRATRVALGGGWREARNDYRFRNSAAATGFDSTERRVNNDARTVTAFASLQHAAAQLLVLGSATGQGLVGARNVRVHDRARSRRERLLVRAAAGPGAWVLGAGLRAVTLSYDDPARPAAGSTSGATSADVDAARAVGGATLQAGVGADRATSTGIARQARGRAFASAAGEWRLHGLLARAGARADAIGGAGMQPSLSLALERPGAIAPFVRAAQAFRAPTLNDLYFAAPQRIVARALAPERVVLDAEGGVRLRAGALSGAGSVFVRRTRDAIVWFPGSIGWSPQNVAREEVAGAEGSLLLATGHLDLLGWASRVRTRLHAGPFVIPTPYVPYLAGGATATARIGASSLAVTLQAQDRRPFLVAPPTRAGELPGVALASVHLGHRFQLARATALVTVGVDNAADVRWDAASGFPSAGRSWAVGLTLTP